MLHLIRKFLGRGCIGCGTSTLALVGCDQLTTDSACSGDILICPRCKQLYCPPVFVTPDLQLRPLSDELRAKASPGNLNALSDYAVVLPNHPAPRTTHYDIILGPRFKADAGVLFVRSFVFFGLCASNASRTRTIRQFVNIQFHVPPSDKREIWQIPELVDFYRKLHPQAKPFPIWLSEGFLPVYLRTIAAGMDDDGFADLLRETVSRRGKSGSTTDALTTHELLMLAVLIDAVRIGADMLQDSMKLPPQRAQELVADTPCGRLLKQTHQKLGM